MDKEYLKNFTKEEIFDLYDAIVHKKRKNYDNITKSKMLDAIFEEYLDYHNIISICTLKELKVLKKMVNGSFEYKISEDNNFAISNLEAKLLITLNKNDIKLMPGLEEPIKTAVNKMNLKEIEEKEKVIIPLLGLLKVMGFERLTNIIYLIKKIYNIDKELDNYLSNSLLFNYYCFITDTDEYKFVAVFRPYLEYIEELKDLYQNKELDIKTFNPTTLTNIFYYDYDKSNKTVSKLVKRLKYPFLIKQINLIALFDSSRKEIKKLLHSDLTETEIDTLINNIPSSSYGGLTKEQYAENILENQKIEAEMTYNYIKQSKSAALSKKDADLFYKTYFAILEYTNNYYHLNNLKIYKQSNLNPYLLVPIIEKFYNNKELIITNFLKENPYKFKKEELEIVNNYKKAYRNLFIIVEYDYEYTKIAFNNTIYMVKGLNSPIDEVILYNRLPYLAMTTLLPFKDQIIYDGILSSYGNNLDISPKMKMELINSLKAAPKIYHL